MKNFALIVGVSLLVISHFVGLAYPQAPDNNFLVVDPKTKVLTLDDVGNEFHVHRSENVVSNNSEFIDGYMVGFSSKDGKVLANYVVTFKKVQDLEDIRNNCLQDSECQILSGQSFGDESIIYKKRNTTFLWFRVNNAVITVVAGNVNGTADTEINQLYPLAHILVRRITTSETVLTPQVLEPPVNETTNGFNRNLTDGYGQLLSVFINKYLSFLKYLLKIIISMFIH